MNLDCLIVIDMLHDFLDRWESNRRERLIASTNSLVTAFRKVERPIVWVRQEFKADLSDAFMEMRDKKISTTIEGTRGSQIHCDLEFQSSDILLVKKRYSAFFGTNLDETLNAFGVRGLVLAGVNTHSCVRMTAMDAYQRDLRVVLAAECIGSYDDEHARISLDYMDRKIGRVMNNARIDAALAGCSWQS